MPSLRQDLDKLLQGNPTTAECAKVIQRHAKKVEDWPAVLRKVADYIEKLPRPIEISEREVKAMVELTLGKIERGESV